MKTSFKQLEVDYQRNLSEYKTTYQDYMIELKNQNGSYWNTEENVTVSNREQNNMIPFLTEPGISKKDCLHACSSDKKCKYVLFSDSGNGECAANQCLKWTEQAGAIIKSKSEARFFNIFVGNSNSETKTIILPEAGIIVYPTPINAQEPAWHNTFSVSVSGNKLSVTRTDERMGWGQMLQLQGMKDTSGTTEYIINVGSSDEWATWVHLPAKGLQVSPIAINRQAPEWTDRFSVIIDPLWPDWLLVERTDQSSGWGQPLQLRAILSATKGTKMQNKACDNGNGPRETNYVYSGWGKPSWKDSNNISFMGDTDTPNQSEWKDLGSATSLSACKDMSFISPKGPFSSVVFVAAQNKCYGGVKGASHKMNKEEGVYSSIPPMGSTNMGGEAVVLYIEKLKELNNALKNNLLEMSKSLKEVNEVDEFIDDLVEDVTQNTDHNIKDDYEKLNRDRIELDKLENEMVSLDAKLGFYSRTTTRQKIIYSGSAILLLIIIAFIIRKSS
jgi:hypothetical protein